MSQNELFIVFSLIVLTTLALLMAVFQKKFTGAAFKLEYVIKGYIIVIISILLLAIALYCGNGLLN